MQQTADQQVHNLIRGAGKAKGERGRAKMDIVESKQISEPIKSEAQISHLALDIGGNSL